MDEGEARDPGRYNGIVGNNSKTCWIKKRGRLNRVEGSGILVTACTRGS